MKTLLLLIGILCCYVNNCLGLTFTAIQTGDFEDPLTWNVMGMTVPTSADDVIIPNGFTVTLNTVNGNCLGLTVGGILVINASRTLIVAGSVTNNGTITANGILALNNAGASFTNAAMSTTTVVAGGALNLSCSLTNSGNCTIAGTLSSNSSILNNSVITVSGTLNSTTGATTLTVAGGANLSVSVGGNMSLTCTLANSGTVTNSGIITAAGAVTNSSTFTNAGTFTANSSVNNSSTFNNNAAAICTINNTFTTSTSIINNGTFTISGSGTFVGNTAATTLTVGAGANLSVSVGGTMNLSCVLANSGIFTSNGTINTNTTVTNNGTMTIGGTFTTSNAITNNNNMTVGGTINANNAGSTFTIGGSASLSVSVGGTLNLSCSTANTGTLTNGGTITLNGSSNSHTGITKTLTNQAGGVIIVPLTKTLNFGQNLANAGNIQIGGTVNCGVGTVFSAGTTITIENTGSITSTSMTSTLTFNYSYTLSINFTGYLRVLQGGGTVNVVNLNFQGTNQFVLFPLNMQIIGNTITATTITFGSGSSMPFVFSNAGAITATTIDVRCSSAVTFGGGSVTATNFTIFSSGGVSFNSSGGNINFTNLLMNSGSSGGLNVSNTGSVTITNTLTHNGTGTVNLNANPTTYSITNITSGSGNLAARMFVNKTIALSGALTLNSGLVLLASSAYLSAVTFNGGGSGSFVVPHATSTSSYLQTQVNDFATLLFPIGVDASGSYRYTPVTMSPNAVTTFGIRVRKGLTVAADDPNQIVDLEYDIKKISANAVTASATFQWNTLDQKPGFSAAAAYVAHYTSAWTKVNDVSVSGGNPYSATVNGLTSFSPYAVFSLRAIPVTLTRFVAEEQNGDALLSWTTVQEINNKGFEIERSQDALHFEKIGFVAGAGSTKETYHYKFVDYRVTDVTYYRLKQIDLDGRFSYSRALAVIPSTTMSNESIVFPNPSSSGQFYLQTQTDVLSWKMLGMDGKIIEEGKGRKVMFDLSKQGRGSYLIRVETDNGVIAKKLLVE